MSVFRKTAFILYGSRNFTKNAYTRHAKKFEQDALDVNLTGTSVMITGANSGLGREVAGQLAKRGATVHMVCRNEERAKAAQEELQAECPKGKLIVHILDLSSPTRVCEFANDFVSSGEALHVLVNNAGTMTPKKSKSERTDNVDEAFATNIVAPFALTRLLLPVLERTAEDSHSPSRVIMISSGGMLTEKLDIADPEMEKQKYDGLAAYAQHKRAQVVLTETFAQQHNSEKVAFYAMHPGWVDTPMLKEHMPQFHKFYEDSLRTTEQGADTTVWLAASKEVLSLPNHGSGEFFFDRSIAAKHLPMAFTQISDTERTTYVDYVSSIVDRVTAE